MGLKIPPPKRWMHSALGRAIAAVLVSAGVTGLAVLALPDGLALEAETDIVGYPTFNSFNIDVYFWAYGLVVIFFPAAALGLYLALTRMFVGRVGSWRPLPPPRRHIEELPDSFGWREWAVGAGRTLFVGGVLGLEAAVWVGEATEAVLLSSVGYTAGVTLLGLVAERSASRDRFAVMSAVNVLAAPILVVGLLAISVSTEVTVASSREVHSYSWLPAWLVLMAAAALLAVLLASLRHRRSRGAVGALERRVVLLVAAPVGLFVFMAGIPGDLGTLDAYEEGQGLAAAELVREGAFPWRDVMVSHGLLFDVFRGIVGFSVFDESRWGLVATDAMLYQPLAWVALYYLCAYLLWTNWLYLLGTQLVIVTGYVTAIEPRIVLLAPFCLLLLAALLAKPTAPRAVAFTVMVVAQVLIVPEALVVAAAAFVALAAFELSYRQPDQRLTAGFPRLKICLATVGAIAIAWSVLLAAFGALDDWVYSFAATIPGHRLTGGIAPLVSRTDLEVVVPVALVLAVYAFVVARAYLRRPFAYEDWLMVALGALTLFYFAKFLSRMDPPHLEESFSVAIPLLFYIVFRAVTFGEAWLARYAAARGLTRFPRRHTLTLPLLLVLLLSAPVALPDVVRAAPGHFAVEVGQEPEVDRIGYARPGENDTRVLGLLDERLGSLLEPGDTVFDFSNAPGVFHYVLDVPPSTRYYHVSFAIRQRTQSDLIRRLEARPPGAVVWGSERAFNNLPSWDLISNHVRHYDVSDYLLDNYVPVQEVGAFVLMAPRSSDLRSDRSLYFRAEPCDWGYVPSFFAPTPAASAKSVTLPVRQLDESTRYGMSVPGEAADYDWLEVVSDEPLADGRFELTDRQGGAPSRSISFKTRGRGETTVRVKVGACSQWRGYEPGTLYLSTDVPQSIRAVRLVR